MSEIPQQNNANLNPGQQNPQDQPAANQPAANQPAANQPAANQPAATQPAATQPAATQPAATGQATQLQVSTPALPIEVNNEIDNFKQEIRQIAQSVSNDPEFVTAITDGVTDALQQLLDSRLNGSMARSAGIGATTNTAVAAAVSGARNVGMGFVDFTQGLISGTFAALVKATIDQMKGYSEMVADLTKSLKDYALENISESAVNDKLADLTFSEEAKSYAVVKDQPRRAYHLKRLYALAPMTGGHKVNILDVFGLKKLPKDGGVMADVDNKVIDYAALETKFSDYEKDAKNDPATGIGLAQSTTGSGGTTTNTYNYTGDEIKLIRNAIKYGLAKDGMNQLRQMASEGMARIVVTEGEINTKLTFSIKSDETTNRNSQSKTESNVGVSANVNARAGWLWGRASASVSSNYNRLDVNTVDDKTVSNIQSSTEMFGEVRVKFKTDYRPMNLQQSILDPIA